MIWGLSLGLWSFGAEMNAWNTMGLRMNRIRWDLGDLWELSRKSEHRAARLFRWTETFGWALETNIILENILFYNQELQSKVQVIIHRAGHPKLPIQLSTSPLSTVGWMWTVEADISTFISSFPRFLISSLLAATRKILAGRSTVVDWSPSGYKAWIIKKQKKKLSSFNVWKYRGSTAESELPITTRKSPIQ